jgi:protein-disulfide isomerase
MSRSDHAQERRARLLRIAAATAFLAIIAVVVVVVVASGGGGSGTPSDHPAEVDAVDSLLAKMPQQGLTLGEPSAPVELIEYGDLQCPYCKEFSEAVLPQIIEGQVAAGKAKLSFRNFLIIGPDSLPAGAAALAAGQQGRGWNFIELFYRNQGEENSGYVTDGFLESIAAAAGVKDLPRWNAERRSPKLEKEAEATTAEAGGKLGFGATPSFAIRGPKSEGLELLGTPEGARPIEEKIEEVS